MGFRVAELWVLELQSFAAGEVGFRAEPCCGRAVVGCRAAVWCCARAAVGLRAAESCCRRAVVRFRDAELCCGRAVALFLELRSRGF